MKWPFNWYTVNYLKVKARSCSGKSEYIENGSTFTDLSTHVPGYENTLAIVQIEHGETRMEWSIGHSVAELQATVSHERNQSRHTKWLQRVTKGEGKVAKAHEALYWRKVWRSVWEQFIHPLDSDLLEEITTRSPCAVDDVLREAGNLSCAEGNLEEAGDTTLSMNPRVAAWMELSVTVICLPFICHVRDGSQSLPYATEAPHLWAPPQDETFNVKYLFSF